MNKGFFLKVLFIVVLQKLRQAWACGTYLESQNLGGRENTGPLQVQDYLALPSEFQGYTERLHLKINK